MMFMSALLIFVGVVLTMSEIGGLWGFGCILVGGIGLVAGIVMGR